MVSICFFCSRTSFNPRIPMLATPCSTYCGISSSRRNRISSGKLEETAFSFLVPLEILIPHSSRSLRDFSLSRPLFCKANFSLLILDFDIGPSKRQENFWNKKNRLITQTVYIFRSYDISLPSRLCEEMVMMMHKLCSHFDILMKQMYRTYFN